MRRGGRGQDVQSSPKSVTMGCCGSAERRQGRRLSPCLDLARIRRTPARLISISPALARCSTTPFAMDAFAGAGAAAKTLLLQIVLAGLFTGDLLTDRSSISGVVRAIGRIDPNLPTGDLSVEDRRGHRPAAAAPLPPAAREGRAARSGGPRMSSAGSASRSNLRRAAPADADVVRRSAALARVRHGR